jgi:hypothetical protein
LTNESNKQGCLLLRRNSPRQNPDIVDKPLDQILVLVLRVAGHGELALAPDLGCRDLDFEFVFKVVF